MCDYRRYNGTRVSDDGYFEVPLLPAAGPSMEHPTRVNIRLIGGVLFPFRRPQSTPG